jgi:hypothetical protein
MTEHYFPSRAVFGEDRDFRRKAALRRSETLDYIQSMLGQLRTMAQAERCDMLAYFIEMSYVEASDIIRGERPSNTGNRHRHPPA